MKVWHALILAGLIAAYVNPAWLRRSLLFLLIFFCVTGCDGNASTLGNGAM